jgi:hypothetical protein
MRKPVRPSVNSSAHASSVAYLQSMEKAPRHSWTEADRELLCVLYRWYDDSEALNITKVFNSIADLNLKVRVIHGQFHSCIRLYGGEAYPEYGRVYAVPFYDPEGHYSDICNVVEATARDLNVNLQRRQVERKLDSGWAEFAESPRTRRWYEDRVQQARKEQEEATREISIAVQSSPYACSLGGMPLILDDEYNEREVLTDLEEQEEATREISIAVQSSPYACSLGGMPLILDDEYNEREVLTDLEEQEEATREISIAVQSSPYACSLGGMPLILDDEYNEREVLTDLEEKSSMNLKPTPSRPRLPIKMPHLAFRCWDGSNRLSATYNGGFVAKAFVDETGALPPPMSPLDPYWKYLAVCRPSILSPLLEMVLMG